MIEAILEPENLAQAWKRVKVNQGAPGIDGMTVEAFPAFARANWPRIAKAIKEGNYRPAPVKRVWIPKPDGTKRPLGIPTVLDRMIQQAVAQALGPLFEATSANTATITVPAAPPIKRWPEWKPAGKKAAATPWNAT